VIDDPELDNTPVIETYAKAVRTHKAIKDAITDNYNQWQGEWQGEWQDVEQMQISKHSLLNTIEGLKEQHNIACDRDETLGKCRARGKTLAKQKTSKRFLDSVYAGISESVEAEKRRQTSDAQCKYYAANWLIATLVAKVISTLK
jgi:hypothetical protein